VNVYFLYRKRTDFAYSPLIINQNSGKCMFYNIGRTTKIIYLMTFISIFFQFLLTPDKECTAPSRVLPKKDSTKSFSSILLPSTKSSTCIAITLSSNLYWIYRFFFLFKNRNEHILEVIDESSYLC